MERNPVSSSNVASIGYDVDSQTLEVEFTDGSIYQYAGVSSSENDGLMAADSKGKYLNSNIKGRFSYIRL